MYRTLRTLRTIRDRRHRNEDGFTLIELLVVVVIIGILVAIAIPIYMNYQEGAANDAAKSDVRNAVPAVEQAYMDNDYAYPTGATATNGTAQASGTPASCENSGTTPCTRIKLLTAGNYINVSPGNTVEYASTDGKTYTITATATTGNEYTYTNNSTDASAGQIVDTTT